MTEFRYPPRNRRPAPYQRPGDSDWQLWWAWIKARRAGRRSARVIRRERRRAMSAHTDVIPRVLDPDHPARP